MSHCELPETCGEGSPCNRPYCTLPQCVACIADLAHSASAMAAASNSALQREAEAVALSVLRQGRNSDEIAPLLANRILRAIKGVTDVKDPFASYKIKEMEQSRETFERIRGQLDGSRYTCLKIAAIGNSLDFFKPPQVAFAELKELIRKDDIFHHLDADRLETALNGNPGLILYLTDNTGEVVFDIPLYDHLRKKAKRVVLVTKGSAPALNDLTRFDLEKAGLMHRFDEVADTGTDGAGVDWRRVSSEFIGLLDRADLVICKGGANFETVYPHHFRAPAFFLFKVKCRPDQMDFFTSPPEVFWGLWRNGSSE